MRHAFLATLIAGASFQTHALGRLADVTIVDRETGRTLPVYFHRGEHWVAGKPGRRYSIGIRNRAGERLLAVTSVDGINVITGDTARWDQSGYIYGSWQGYEITGWRKSDTEVAAFEFTAEPNSYAARTGRWANVGVIGVALFRERAAPAVTPALGSEERAEERAPEKSASADSAASAAGRVAPRPKLGTGHGAREPSVVESMAFERLHDSPDEIVSIRYDSRANLIAMGVIREPRRLDERGPEPFPGSPLARYVPDPPGAR